jgi:hypothetical protein
MTDEPCEYHVIGFQKATHPLRGPYCEIPPESVTIGVIVRVIKIQEDVMGATYSTRRGRVSCIKKLL